VRVLWRTLEGAIEQALAGLTLADLLFEPPAVERRIDARRLAVAEKA
jgi:hypothetical protein